jgi:hypothetical protein
MSLIHKAHLRFWHNTWKCFWWNTHSLVMNMIVFTFECRSWIAKADMKQKKNSGNFSLSVLFLELNFCKKNLGFCLSEYCEWGTSPWPGSPCLPPCLLPFHLSRSQYYNDCPIISISNFKCSKWQFITAVFNVKIVIPHISQI